MSNNPNNYLGATLTLVGYAAGEARPPAYDKDGERGILELSIPVSQGYKKDGAWVETSTVWYSYTASGEHAAALKAIQKGDKVRIDDAKQEVREYETKDGQKKLGIGLRFGTVTVLESKSGSGGGFTPDEAAPW